MTPNQDTSLFFSFDANNIIKGNVLDVLKIIPDNSIDCVVTSPPYWALRDYGSDVETVWDGNEACEHEWGGETGRIQRAGSTGVGAKQEMNSSLGNFCTKCNAWKGQLGLEPTFDLYIKHLCDIFDEIKRVLKKTGTCWVNLGDTYYTKSGSGFLNNNLGSTSHTLKTGISKANEIRGGNELPSKSLCLIPFRFAIEMCNRGWTLRNTIIWHKPNCMPSSAKDRFTVDFEYVFFFVKNKKYYFETQYEAYAKPMNRWGGDKLKANGKSSWDKGTGQASYRKRNMRPNPQGRYKRTVWRINTKPFPEAHFAVFPEELIETPIKAGCPQNGIVLDPFIGSGTTALVALKNNRRFFGIELNPKYIEIAVKRIKSFLGQTQLGKLVSFQSVKAKVSMLIYQWMV